MTSSEHSWLRSIFRRAVAVSVLAVSGLTSLSASSKKKEEPKPEVPALQLSGGRTLTWEREFSNDRDVRIKRGFWTRVLDIVAGPPDLHIMVRPYSVVTDSTGRVIVTDPGVSGVHVFDFAQQKYKFLAREGRETLVAPQCVAVDDKDNIYVTDSETGKIFVFDRDGKFRRTVGSLKGGEGYFKRPTGIAVDAAAQRIYVSDTTRHKIFVLDMQGSVVQTIGKRGNGQGEFNFPTELRLNGNELAVVDAMNFRVQVLDRSGQFLFSFGKAGEINGTMFRPKGVGIDSEGDYYVVDALFDTVQAFNRQGQLLYYFGRSGDGPQEFQLPAGLFIDRNDRIYVVDSYNRRVQVFRYSGQPRQSGGGGQ